MPKFEVYVPPAPPQLPVALTLRVESENWLAALKVGLQRVGGGELAANILCDIQADGSIHVTDPAGARVFRIREMREAAQPIQATLDMNQTAVMHAPSPVVAPAPPPPSPPAPRKELVPEAPPPPPPQAAPPPPVLQPAPRAPEPLPRPPRPAPAPDSVASAVEEVAGAPEPQFSVIGRISREPWGGDALADAFFKTAELNQQTDRDEGLRFILNLAMDKVRCDAGSVLLSRFRQGDLVFVVTRGPKADEILRLRLSVPFGKGIVGFSAQENVCLAVSDVEKDPRYYSGVSEAVGYPTRSALCAPISAGGRVHGALELLNKGSGAFTASDLAVLSYLGHKAGEFLERLA